MSEKCEGDWTVFCGQIKGDVVNYINLPTELNDFGNRKFSLQIPRNAKMSPNAMNTVTFQVTTMESSRDPTEKLTGSILDSRLICFHKY